MEHKGDDLQLRLDCLLKLNSLLATTHDEKALIQQVLALVQQMAGATAATFVPIDEFGQPLPAFIQGNVPLADLRAWSGYVDSSHLRDRCRDCVVHFSNSELTCPLLKLPWNERMQVQCLPLKRDNRILGMFNLYMSGQAIIDPDLLTFFQSILDEIALAVDALHLRNQEMSTLRQLQMMRSSLLDLETSLSTLLSQVQAAFEADFSEIIVQTSNETKPRLVLRQNLADQVREEDLLTLISRVLEGGAADPAFYSGTIVSLTGQSISVLAAPLNMTDRPVVGVILVGSRFFRADDPAQQAALQMVASQAALLIEHNQMMIDLEYKVVVEERSRLAREIHDGIAQLLAFLKLQTGQMQTLLSQGHYNRLEQALKVSYQALAEAYLSIRQTIDDLHLTPEDGLSQWLEKITADFHTSSGLPTGLTIQPGLHNLPDEVQLQLIRITQEALNNIRKHAKASQVTVSAREWEGDFILEIHDNGEGFSTEDIPGVSQYGLRGMRERSELMGADFQVISQPRQGTTVKVSLPVPVEEPQL